MSRAIKSTTCGQGETRMGKAAWTNSMKPSMPLFQRFAGKGKTKSAVEIGTQTGVALADLDGGSNGVIDLGATGVVTSVETVNGVITATGTAAVGSFTYILTPTVINGQVQWASSGTCVANGVC